ncbi:heterokaryon incompatibility protein-domain-containing protein [Diplogelasinospora grovesii]|uniref:Heterokaryon incompatibility protein-domain-containing protein n=1 Tax=Diplogelasinospora grovesii TaxID=303347 RepID=A0AAN6NCB6_9PEZI|nr:heterokaryon incompatibility protein-domain-containing protein [Diplogelasinospora grovesii]
MPIFNKYHYKPLCAEDAVRLIVLDPATDEYDPLGCSIIQRRRHSGTKIVDYSAVSYAWGVQLELSRTLEIRGKTGNTSYLRITPNVDDLLRRLRKIQGNLRCPLWIDAICLNQDDEKEKAQQIPLMGPIYEEAKNVHIWLGLDDHLTAKFAPLVPWDTGYVLLRPNEMARRVACCLRYTYDGYVGAGLCSFLDFFDRAWFSRRWIIQEACLARHATVHCGKYSIPLPLLVSAATRFQALDISHYPIAVAANLRRPATNLSMLDALWNFHQAGCSEHKDRIAALFSLVPEINRFPLDYTLHWTELYKQVASFALNRCTKDTRLQVLLHLFEFGPVSSQSLPTEVSSHYPSWVPDWSKSRQRALPYHSPARNPDNVVDRHPASPGGLGSDKAALKFHDDALWIYWHASLLVGAGQEGREVTYAKMFKNLDEDQREKRVLKVLDELFPPTGDTFDSVNLQQILALSYLLQTIAQFRDPGAIRDKKKLNSPHLDEYMGNISQMLSTDVFDSLRDLDYILEEFCLFELERERYCYGLGPRATQAGDVMIPLWRPEQMKPDKKYLRVPGRNQKKSTIYLVTMLVVRRSRQNHRCGGLCYYTGRKSR